MQIRSNCMAELLVYYQCMSGWRSSTKWRLLLVSPKLKKIYNKIKSHLAIIKSIISNCFPNCTFFSPGTISVRRKLKKAALYRLRVEARYNGVSSGYALVIIRVTTPKKKLQLSSDNGLKFPSPIYSVIIPYNMIVGQTILHLRVEKSKGFTNSTIRYRVQSVDPYYRNPFFSLNPTKGSLKITRELTELVSSDKPTSFVLQVIGRVQGKPDVFASTQVSVVVVPEYVGNDYVKSSLEAVKNKSSVVGSNDRLRSQRNGSSPGQSKLPRGQTEFSLHRIFRRPSREAQIMSQADLQFNKIIREIKREVADKLIGEFSVCYVIFSNSLIIHQVTTKKIKTVTEVSVTGLN